mgnify:CR=1 FL=1
MLPAAPPPAPATTKGDNSYAYLRASLWWFFPEDLLTTGSGGEGGGGGGGGESGEGGEGGESGDGGEGCEDDATFRDADGDGCSSYLTAAQLAYCGSRGYEARCLLLTTYYVLPTTYYLTRTTYYLLLTMPLLMRRAATPTQYSQLNT